mgnify:CR=1 FL=1
MKKRFVSAALAAVMALSMTACGSSNSAAETTAADTEAAESQAEETTAEEAKTTDGGTLIVGFDQDFPPMGFVGDDGEYTGFDLELAQAVCDLEGWEQNVWVWNIRHSRLPGILKIWSLSPAISTASGMDLR